MPFLVFLLLSYSSHLTAIRCSSAKAFVGVQLIAGGASVAVRRNDGLNASGVDSFNNGIAVVTGISRDGIGLPNASMHA